MWHERNSVFKLQYVQVLSQHLQTSKRVFLPILTFFFLRRIHLACFKTSEEILVASEMWIRNTTKIIEILKTKFKSYCFNKVSAWWAGFALPPTPLKVFREALQNTTEIIGIWKYTLSLIVSIIFLPFESVFLTALSLPAMPL